MVNAILIVWREAIEALLVVGILHTWLTIRDDRAQPAALTVALLALFWIGAIVAWRRVESASQP